jgi:hypothetical protein
MTPIHLENESEQEITKTTEENQDEKSIFDVPESTLVDLDTEKEEEEERIHKRMNDIHTFQEHDGELALAGTDEYGKEFTIWFDTYDFLQWINNDQIEYIKQNLIKYIEQK